MWSKLLLFFDGAGLIPMADLVAANTGAASPLQNGSGYYEAIDSVTTLLMYSQQSKPVPAGSKCKLYKVVTG